MKKYDAIIIGGGPSGLFAAKYILENSINSTVLIFEKGKRPEERCCPEKNLGCNRCKVCSKLSGVGGAGLYSDGKLILDLHSGGKLEELTNVDNVESRKLLNDIVSTLKMLDGVSERSPSLNESEKLNWQGIFNAKNLDIKFYDVIHMGTNNLRNITINFLKLLKENYPDRFFLQTDTEITSVKKYNTSENNISCVKTSNNKLYFSKNVVFAVGKTGNIWMNEVLSSYKINFQETNHYVGIRFETDSKNLTELFKISFDPKIWSRLEDKKVKMHCACRNGSVISTYYYGYQIAGGHTVYTANNRVSPELLSERSNFNILVSINDIGLVRRVLDDFNKINSQGLVVQKLGDFLCSKKSLNFDNMPPKGANVVSGNICEILNKVEKIGDLIAEFINRLGEVFPGIMNEDNLIYGPSVEWLMNTVEVNESMETSCTGWFAVGDGAGLSQGIVHSAATGIIAAKKICHDLEDTNAFA